jgi:hypothetical protein
MLEHERDHVAEQRAFGVDLRGDGDLIGRGRAGRQREEQESAR